MRSDDCSSDNDRQGIREIPDRQSNTVPQMRHPLWESNENHRTEDKTQRRRGHHLPSLGHEGNDETNEQESDEVSGVNASGCEEQIGAEMMLGNLVLLNHCKYRWLDKST